MGFMQFGIYYALWNLIYKAFDAFITGVKTGYQREKEKQKNGDQ